MEDDGVRERHGVSCRKWGNDGSAHVNVIESEDCIYTHYSDFSGARLTPWQARYLAAKLYRLSRRIRQRTD